MVIRTTNASIRTASARANPIILIKLSLDSDEPGEDGDHDGGGCRRHPGAVRETSCHSPFGGGSVDVFLPHSADQKTGITQTTGPV
jgi:hypothetical protein